MSKNIYKKEEEEKEERTEGPELVPALLLTSSVIRVQYDPSLYTTV